MNKLFPKLGKLYNYSFISEHMIINTEFMKSLINEINLNSNISGDIWYEKVINSINNKDLIFSGFSEFETYGTFVNKYYENYYIIRPWKSLRGFQLNYNYTKMSYKDIKTIAKEYDAITFEH